MHVTPLEDIPSLTPVEPHGELQLPPSLRQFYDRKLTEAGQTEDERRETIAKATSRSDIESRIADAYEETRTSHAIFGAVSFAGAAIVAPALFSGHPIFDSLAVTVGLFGLNAVTTACHAYQYMRASSEANFYHALAVCRER